LLYHTTKTAKNQNNVILQARTQTISGRGVNSYCY